MALPARRRQRRVLYTCPAVVSTGGKGPRKAVREPRRWNDGIRRSHHGIHGTHGKKTVGTRKPCRGQVSSGRQSFHKRSFNSLDFSVCSVYSVVRSPYSIRDIRGSSLTPAGAQPPGGSSRSRG